MIRGVSFRVSQTIENVLYQILNCIDIKKYCWYNIESQNEVWDRKLNNLFFDKNYYDGNDMLKYIQLSHYIVFLKLQAYYETGIFYDIHSYEEFQTSDCQLLFLINDCEFVEIYSKEGDVINAIYNNALVNNYSNIEYITDDNDGRTKLDVL